MKTILFQGDSITDGENLCFDEMRITNTPTPRTGKVLAVIPMEIFEKAEELIGALLFLVHKDASSSNFYFCRNIHK